MDEVRHSTCAQQADTPWALVASIQPYDELACRNGCLLGCLLASSLSAALLITPGRFPVTYISQHSSAMRQPPRPQPLRSNDGDEAGEDEDEEDEEDEDEEVVVGTEKPKVAMYVVEEHNAVKDDENEHDTEEQGDDGHKREQE
jgi:hypothetical protein